MIALFCGSRDWVDARAIIDGLLMAWKIAQRDFKAESRTQVTILTGGAPGADTIAHQAAKDMGFLTLIEPADWRQYGKAAGPIRNRKMLDMGPDIVFAFQLGASKGTQDLLDEAARRCIKAILHQVPA